MKIKVDWNEKYYDFLRRADENDQIRIIMDEVENMEMESVCWMVNCCDKKTIDFGEIENYKDEILNNLESFIELNFDENLMDEDNGNMIADDLDELIYPMTFKGVHKYSSYYGGETIEQEITFTDSFELGEFLATSRTRGIYPVLENNTLTIPKDDLGGGIVLFAKLERVENE